MNLSCGSRTIKYLIFSFNFFFVITGIILITVGASIRTYFTEYNYFLNNQYFSLPNLLIVTGSFIFVICFLGCYGAMKNSWIMLSIFSILLAVIFIFEFSAGIAGYVLRNKTTGYLEKSMQESLHQYYDMQQPATGLWDYIQPKFECCGVKGSEDWTTISNNVSLPISCCPQKVGQWGLFSCNAYKEPVTSPATTISPNNTINSTSTSAPARNKGTVVNRRRRQASETATDVSSNTNLMVDPTVKTNITVIPIIINSTTSPPATSPITPASTSSTVIPSTTTPYQVGCEAAFGEWVKSHAVDIGAVCFTLAVLQLIGIGFACHLSKQLKNSYYST